ncbi:MAG: transporter [Myxococcaceae bacterium]
MRFLVACALFAAGLAATPARACATCACGDPTLTSMGVEQPYRGRLRFSAQLRAYTLGLGAVGQGASQVREVRLDLNAAYAPVEWLFLNLQVPLQAREVRNENLSREAALGLGEIEITGRVFGWKDRSFAPRHLVSMLGGLKLPTSFVQVDRAGAPLSIDGQLGTGSLDPIAGLAYAGFYSTTWSFFASATGYFPTHGRFGFRGGNALRTAVGTQFQPIRQLAFRLAIDGRLEAPNRLFGVDDGISGGFLGFLSPDILWSPRMDLLVIAGVRWPVMNFIQGNYRQSPIITLAVAWDR